MNTSWNTVEDAPHTSAANSAAATHRFSQKGLGIVLALGGVMLIGAGLLFASNERLFANITGNDDDFSGAEEVALEDFEAGESAADVFSDIEDLLAAHQADTDEVSELFAAESAESKAESGAGDDNAEEQLHAAAPSNELLNLLGDPSIGLPAQVSDALESGDIPTQALEQAADQFGGNAPAAPEAPQVPEAPAAQPEPETEYRFNQHTGTAAAPLDLRAAAGNAPTPPSVPESGLPLLPLVLGSVLVSGGVGLAVRRRKG